VGFWPDGAFDMFNGVDVPHKKIILAPLALCDERPWYQLHDEVIRWMDHWLKGIDTGFMEEPPIKLFVGGINEWHYENEWPLARTSWTKLYLRARGRLMPEAPIFEEGPDSFTQQPLDETSDVNTVGYTTAPFGKDTEITGPSVLDLYAAIDQDETNWNVNLYDVDAYGNKLPIISNWLKASHRALDEKRSEAWLPRHDHTKNVPVPPGEIVEYKIAISPISHVFKAGHSLRVEVASMDNMPGGLHVCSSKTTTHYLHHDPAHASYLYVPVIPE
jgi:predicted acyl esterase